jgi:hypothetical protein
MEADWDEVSSDVNSSPRQLATRWRTVVVSHQVANCAAPRNFSWQGRDVVSDLHLNHCAHGMACAAGSGLNPMAKHGPPL